MDLKAITFDYHLSDDKASAVLVEVNATNAHNLVVAAYVANSPFAAGLKVKGHASIKSKKLPEKSSRQVSNESEDEDYVNDKDSKDYDNEYEDYVDNKDDEDKDYNNEDRKPPVKSTMNADGMADGVAFCIEIKDP
jgi:hypothetical protein